jgi:hypothetical protein
MQHEIRAIKKINKIYVIFFTHLNFVVTYILIYIIKKYNYFHIFI